MSFISRKKSVIVAGILLVLMVTIGVNLKAGDNSQSDDGIDVSFSEEDLDSLSKALEGLEFDDLGGLTGEDVSGVGFSEEDLDSLGAALEGLEFEDLGGLIEN